MAPQPVRKAVFPAAGLGTRFLPASKAIPKEMLPIVDTPVIEYAVAEARASGVTRIALVTSRGKSCMEDHFDRAPELEAVLERRGKRADLERVRSVSDGVTVTTVRQADALGLGHAVLTARPLVGDEPFAVVLCDDVMRATPPALRQLLDVHERTGASVLCIEPVPADATASYGIVAVEQVDERLYRVRDLVEKPSPRDAPSDLAIIGRYVLTPRVFDVLEDTGRGAGGEIQLTDAIRGLLADEPVYAWRFQGDRFDAGSKLGFLKATVELALDRDDVGGEFRAWLGSLGL